MAPVKGPKVPTKIKEKTIEKPIKKPKTKKKNFQSFSMYIYKVMKTTGKGENIGISRRSMQTMNSFVADMMEKIAVEAGRLVAHSKKTTMSSREVQAAIKLLIPGELATHANIEAMKALAKYHQYYGKNGEKNT